MSLFSLYPGHPDSAQLSPATRAVMADYQYGGSEEENAELRKLEAELVRYESACKPPLIES